MADIKTILRELSVILGYILSKYDLEFTTEILNVKKYLEFIRKYCKNINECNSEIQKIEQEENLMVHKSIIGNGLNLGQILYEKLKLDGDIVWSGAQVKSKYPFDIKIGNTGISLKEASFILKNPSFSNYLNALTQPSIPFVKVHVFRSFAEKEFKLWFDYTFMKLKEIATKCKDNEKIFIYSKRGTFIKRLKDKLIFGDADNEISISMEGQINEIELNKRLGGFIFEHTFSKWIKDNLEKNDNRYNELKKTCSLKAGENLKNYIYENLNLNSREILELMQIYDENYYYGKSFGEAKIYKVPKNIECKVELTNIEVKVPSSQLNVYFTFKISNINGINDVEFRVECRYSHGQFKGIPEAKLYYTDDINHLRNLYMEIN
ncbi:MAG: hypothetical protein L0Y79_13215 [Chlorobi bacterium]|nr:hypothetical protein [Chlorobiota bacterium]MCI0715702.1 hypothetical protein [Chlorobiota bacterium]